MNDTETPEAYAVQLAWRMGFLAGEMALAARCEALEGAWKHVKAPTWEEQVAARVGTRPMTTVPTFEQCMASWDEDDMAEAA